MILSVPVVRERGDDVPSLSLPARESPEVLSTATHRLEEQMGSELLSTPCLVEVLGLPVTCPPPRAPRVPALLAVWAVLSLEIAGLEAEFVSITYPIRSQKQKQKRRTTVCAETKCRHDQCVSRCISYDNTKTPEKLFSGSPGHQREPTEANGGQTKPDNSHDWMISLCCVDFHDVHGFPLIFP